MGLSSPKTILIVCATELERQPINECLNMQELNLSIDYLVTGVGMVSTAFALGQHLANKKYDLIINAGIAGAFDDSLNIGEVVEVQSDQLSELGAEDGQDFLTIEEMGMKLPSFYDLIGIISNHHDISHNLKKVKGITVNTVHGKSESIAEVKARFQAQVESMEGAAFFHAIKHSNQTAIQLRSISNAVKTRDKSQWNIPLALDNLSQEVYNIIKAYDH